MVKQEDLSVIEHLDELRKRLIISIIAFIIGTVAAYSFAKYAIDFLMIPIAEFKLTISYFSITEGFITRLQLAAFIGVILASPIIIYEAAAFINPGLTRKEKKFLYINVFLLSSLFLIGIAFGYSMILPYTLNFLITFGKSYLNPVLRGRTYFNFIGIYCLYFGIVFMTPRIFMLFAKLSLLSSKLLRKIRKYVIIAVIMIEGMLLPGADMLTFITAAIPVLGLYELSIWIICFGERKKKKALNKKIEEVA